MSGRAGHSRGRGRLTLLVAAVATLAVVAGCGSSGSNSASGSSTGTYKIGFEALTSGPAASTGNEILEGAKTAVSEINSTKFLGSGAKLQMDVVDTGGDPAKAIAAVTQWGSGGYSGVVCCALSAVGAAVKPVLIAQKLPAVLTVATLASLSESPWIFRPSPSMEVSGYDSTVKAVLKKFPNVKKAALITTKDADGPVADADIFAKSLTNAGVTEITKVSTLTADTDMTGAATQALAGNPGVVVESMLNPTAALLIKALRARGYTGPIVSTKAIASAEAYNLAGSAMTDTYMPIEFIAPGVNSIGATFTKEFKAATGNDPSVFAAQGYQAVMMLAAGLKKSGDGKSPNVSAALAAKITTMDSVFGSLTIKNGQGVLSGTAPIITWTSDGKLEKWSGS